MFVPPLTHKKDPLVARPANDTSVTRYLAFLAPTRPVFEEQRLEVEDPNGFEVDQGLHKVFELLRRWVGIDVVVSIRSTDKLDHENMSNSSLWCVI